MLDKLSVDCAGGDSPSDTALMRRVDWRILPVMFLTYFLQFLDKLSLNVFPFSQLACDSGESGLKNKTVRQRYGPPNRPGHEWERLLLASNGIFHCVCCGRDTAGYVCSIS